MRCKPKAKPKASRPKHPYVECFDVDYLDRVMQIENESFTFPWGQDDFGLSLRCEGVFGLVAVQGKDALLGYILAQIIQGRYREGIKVLNLAVAEDCRKRGIATMLMDQILGPECFVIADVDEHNLTAQLLFKSLGFRATKTVYNPEYESNSYRFRWESQENVCQCH